MPSLRTASPEQRFCDPIKFLTKLPYSLGSAVVVDAPLPLTFSELRAWDWSAPPQARTRH
jgi:hypothetical protein